MSGFSDSSVSPSTVAFKSFGYSLTVITFKLSRLHPLNSPSDCSPLLAYRLTLHSGIWLGPLIFMYTFFRTLLFHLTLPLVSGDLTTLLISLLNYFTLSANHLSLTALKVIANLSYYPTLLSWHWFQSTTILLTFSAITPDMASPKTTYITSDNHNHYWSFITYTHIQSSSHKLYVLLEFQFNSQETQSLSSHSSTANTLEHHTRRMPIALNLNH
jgi:hypothetical protein